MNKTQLRFSLILTALLGISDWTARNARAQLFAVDWDSGNLYAVSTSNAALTLVGNTGIVGPSGIAEIEFSPSGTLYGFSAGLGLQTLYTINPATAVATPIGQSGLNFVAEGGLAFAPNGTAYATENVVNNSTDQLFTINLATGAASIVGTISGGNRDINGLAYRSDGQLIGLDRTTNSLLIIDPTTAVATQLAVVPSTVGGAGGMTVLNGIGYYSTSGPGGTIPGSNMLYSFDLFSGASTPIGTFNGTITGTGISGLAAPVPEPSTFALAALGAATLLAARRRFF